MLRPRMDEAGEELVALQNAPTVRSASNADTRTVRVLSIMEAGWVTGPAKNMLEFAARNQMGTYRLHVSMSFATFQRGSGKNNAFVEAARNTGLQVDIIDEAFAFDPRSLRKLRALVRGLEPEIIQSHNFKGHFLVRFAGLHRLSRWVAFHHGYTQTDWKNRIYNRFDRWSLPAARRVVTVCRPFAEQLQRMGVAADRLSIQHNTVKPFEATAEAEVLRLRQVHQIPPNSPVVLSVGRLSSEKGFLDLVEAVGLILSDGPAPDVRFVIVGDGPQRAEIEERARRLGVADCVILAGQQRQMNGYYGMADFVVLPSHTEGSPNVLLEAMAAGKAIVATRVGGIPEIVRAEETALLVGNSKPAELAAAIRRILNDAELRRRLGSAALIESKQFDPDHYCASLCQIYAQVLSGA